MNIELEGRVGVLILDTGYHVPQPVTVMKDSLYPHTGSNMSSNVIECRMALRLTFSPFYLLVGWFKPGGTSRSRRLYNYTFHPSGRYVLWDVKEIRKGVEECESALIYTHQVFLMLFLSYFNEIWKHKLSSNIYTFRFRRFYLQLTAQSDVTWFTTSSRY